ncbi:energy transducer TonB [Noviherbaspirillum cavernae]|nr:energy transducer TonB [Noviherbaspirillum cavernae]
MSGTNFSRSGLLTLIAGLHVTLLWAMTTVFNKPLPIEVPVPIVMAEMLPLQPQVQPQRQPEPEPAVKPAPKPTPVKQVKPAKPTVTPRPTPAPVPTPNTTPSESAISVPQASSQPAPAHTSSAAAESAAPSPAPAPISAPRFDAAYLRNPEPRYPPLARRMGEQGTVMLRVHVTTEGTPDEVQVLTSSGSSMLDESALETVRGKWKFVPAKQGTVAVAGWVKVPISFKLN